MIHDASSQHLRSLTHCGKGYVTSADGRLLSIQEPPTPQEQDVPDPRLVSFVICRRWKITCPTVARNSPYVEVFTLYPTTLLHHAVVAIDSLIIYNSVQHTDAQNSYTYK